MWKWLIHGMVAALTAFMLLAARDAPSAVEHAPPAAPPAHVRERVIELPQDEGVWHTVVVYPERPPADAASRRLAAALASDERLLSLQAQTKTHVYSQRDPLWRERLRTYYGDAAPALIVQRPDGRVCFKASGANLPHDAELLADAVAAAIAECQPRPNVLPLPGPRPAPRIPDLVPRLPRGLLDDAGAWWLIVLPLVAGWAGWRQSRGRRR